ncbi:MAG: molybdopterin molybdotransferase MoeA [Turicibacter sp.]|nr:molybdopterin molybdotransferase MoeA [Turicibacter sp.]
MTKPIELEEALRILRAHVKPQQKTMQIPLQKALGYFLAEDLYAPIDVPTFNRSAMDGYAVKSTLTKGATQKTPLKLQVAAEVSAGNAHPCELEANHVLRIMTGAPIPDGYDAVLRQEDTDGGEEVVEIYTEIQPYTNYGKKGEDIQKGEWIIAKHTPLTPIHLGIIASIGIETVTVLQPLKVGLLSTGDELAQLGKPLKEGQIYNSNQFMLLGRLKELQVRTHVIKQLPDLTKPICEVIDSWINEVDIIVTTGGVSVGEKDVMHDVIVALGAKQLFWRVDIQPGTPVLASCYYDKLILSLSGNPFASLTNFELLVKPICKAFMHQKGAFHERITAILRHDFLKVSKRRRFIRAYYQAGEVFLPTSKHASSVLSSMLDCNCFIDIPEGSPKLEKGMSVNVVMLD